MNYFITPFSATVFQVGGIIVAAFSASFLSALPGQAQPIIQPPPLNRPPIAPPDFRPPDPNLTPTQPVPQPLPSSEQPIRVSKFIYRGNTVFSDQDLDQIANQYLNRPITLRELYQLRSDITKLYVDRGYVTSAAFIPVAGNEAVQTQGGTVTIELIEGTLEAIEVRGSDRLASYVQNRLQRAVSPRVNFNRLQEALRLLQSDPLIRSISANISEGSQVGRSLLTIDIQPNPSFTGEIGVNNARSRTFGQIERGIQLNQANLLGLGDTLSITYQNTNGSNLGDFQYRVPINAQNGSISLGYSTFSGRVVEDPFTPLDIRSNYRKYELSWRQPIYRAATERSLEELAVGVSADRQENETFLLGTPFPLNAGADEQGRTRLTTVRLFQEYAKRQETQSLQLRSQFSIGTSALNTTQNENAPDGRFLSWQGQAAWAKRLGQSILVVRSSIQLSDRPLVSLEQFSLGGLDSVRGYRQNALLSDNGFFGSAEVRIPLNRQGNLQLIPFLDGGIGWTPNSQLTQPLLSTGIGLQWNPSNLNVLLSYGIPLIEIPTDITPRSNWKDQLNFSVRYNFSF